MLDTEVSKMKVHEVPQFLNASLEIQAMFHRKYSDLSQTSKIQWEDMHKRVETS